MGLTGCHHFIVLRPGPAVLSGPATLVAWAKQMGHDDAAELLTETLDEEKAADEKLTQVAESTANAEAATEEKD